jgi:hypothetical protein
MQSSPLGLHNRVAKNLIVLDVIDEQSKKFDTFTNSVNESINWELGCDSDNAIRTKKSELLISNAFHISVFL